MTDYPDPGRRSIRLRGFDYASNAVYFVTLCSSDRRCLFGDVVDGLMILNPIGQLIEREWLNSALIRVELDLHSFVVMPNHLHGLLTVTPAESDRSADDGKDALRASGACHAPLRREPRSLGSLVTGFKSATTRQFRLMTGETGSLWQRGFYEHVVRDERDFARIGGYIANNPANWALDQENIDSLVPKPVRSHQ